MTNKIISAVAVIALCLSVLSLWGTRGIRSNGTFGASAAGNMLAENYIPYVMYNGGWNSAKDFTDSGSVSLTGTTNIGTSGTGVTQFLKGSCALIGTDTSQTASSSKPYDCAVTGVISGDTVIAQLATSTANTNGLGVGWSILASKASTTAGYITVILSNNTGASAVPSVGMTGGVGSSTSYMIWR